MPIVAINHDRSEDGLLENDIIEWMIGRIAGADVGYRRRQFAFHRGYELRQRQSSQEKLGLGSASFLRRESHTGALTRPLRAEHPPFKRGAIHMLKFLAIVVFMSLAFGPATAGVVSTDDTRAALVEQHYADLALVMESTEPLIDYSKIAQQPARCSGGKATTHVILVAPRSVNDNPKFAIDSPVNDVDLVQAAFKARVSVNLDLVSLKGDLATREVLRSAMLDVMTRTKCGDLVAFYFGGHGTYSKFADEKAFEYTQAAMHTRPDEATYPHAQQILRLEATNGLFLLAGHETKFHVFSGNGCPMGNWPRSTCAMRTAATSKWRSTISAWSPAPTTPY